MFACLCVFIVCVHVGMCGLQIITATERMCESYAEADAIEPLYHRKAAQVARTAIVSYVRHPAFGMESVGKAADGARAEASLQHAHTSVCDSLMHVLSPCLGPAGNPVGAH